MWARVPRYSHLIWSQNSDVFGPGDLCSRATTLRVRFRTDSAMTPVRLFFFWRVSAAVTACWLRRVSRVANLTLKTGKTALPPSADTLDKMEHFVELPMRLRQYSSFGVASRRGRSAPVAKWRLVTQLLGLPQIALTDSQITLRLTVGVLRVKPVFLNLIYGFLPSWMLAFVIPYWQDNASSSSASTWCGSTKVCSWARSISAALSRCQRSRSIRYSSSARYLYECFRFSVPDLIAAHVHKQQRLVQRHPEFRAPGNRFTFVLAQEINWSCLVDHTILDFEMVDRGLQFARHRFTQEGQCLQDRADTILNTYRPCRQDRVWSQLIPRASPVEEVAAERYGMGYSMQEVC